MGIAFDDDDLLDVHRAAQEAIDALRDNYSAIPFSDEFEFVESSLALMNVGDAALKLSRRLTPATLAQLRRQPVTVNGVTFPSYTEAVVRICAAVLAPTFADNTAMVGWYSTDMLPSWKRRFQRDGFAVLRWARTRDPESERRFADDSYIQELNKGVDLEFERAERQLIELAAVSSIPTDEAPEPPAPPNGSPKKTARKPRSKIDRDVDYVRQFDSGEFRTVSAFAESKGMTREAMSLALKRGNAHLESSAKPKRKSSRRS